MASRKLRSSRVYEALRGKISKLNKMGMRGAVAERRGQMTWQHARPKNLYWWCVSDVPFFFCTTVGIIQRLRFWLWLQLYVNNVWVIFEDHFLATILHGDLIGETKGISTPWTSLLLPCNVAAYRQLPCSVLVSPRFPKLLSLDHLGGYKTLNKSL